MDTQHSAIRAAMPPALDRAGRHTARQAPQDSTSDRILDAAEEVFLEKGFDKATVRDICSRADANVAAVNYHFRDKRNLYNQVLLSWADRAMGRYPLDMGVEPGMGPEELLEAFIHAELLRLLTSFDGDPARGLRRARLIMGELTNDPPHRELLEALHSPAKQYLDTILSRLLGPAATDKDIDQCCNFVTGQCVHYLLARLAGLEEAQGLETDEDIRALARRITVFSLGGVSAVKAALA